MTAERVQLPLPTLREAVRLKVAMKLSGRAIARSCSLSPAMVSVSDYSGDRDREVRLAAAAGAGQRSGADETAVPAGMASGREPPGAKTLIPTSGATKPLPPGFQTFSHDASRLMASTGQTNNTFFQTWNGLTGGAVTGQMPTGSRGTQPDWSADDSKVVYVVPGKFANQFIPSLAAINLSAAELGGAGDPSLPAFWLPFQDVNAHNHIAQWTQQVVDSGGCDGGAPTCLSTNAACGGSICGTCCNGDICQNGVCGPGIN